VEVVRRLYKHTTHASGYIFVEIFWMLGDKKKGGCWCFMAGGKDGEKEERRD